MMEEADTNRDGKINFEEFVKVYRKYCHRNSAPETDLTPLHDKDSPCETLRLLIGLTLILLILLHQTWINSVLLKISLLHSWISTDLLTCCSSEPKGVIPRYNKNSSECFQCSVSFPSNGIKLTYFKSLIAPQSNFGGVVIKSSRWRFCAQLLYCTSSAVQGY